MTQIAQTTSTQASSMPAHLAGGRRFHTVGTRNRSIAALDVRRPRTSTGLRGLSRTEGFPSDLAEAIQTSSDTSFVTVRDFLADWRRGQVGASERLGLRPLQYTALLHHALAFEARTSSVPRREGEPDRTALVLDQGTDVALASCTLRAAVFGYDLRPGVARLIGDPTLAGLTLLDFRDRPKSIERRFDGIAGVRPAVRMEAMDALRCACISVQGMAKAKRR